MATLFLYLILGLFGYIAWCDRGRGVRSPLQHVHVSTEELR